MRDIHTEHIKLLMLPFLQAEVLFRAMTDREESVNKGHKYYLEYLKLMNHYTLLEKDQVKAWKQCYKDHVDEQKRKRDSLAKVEEDSEQKPQHPMMMLAAQFEDRDAKIAAYKLKMAIEQNLTTLKDYKDEKTKREFYKMQIQFSILKAFD